ncbi:hypothetical protein BU24DRAFT_420038 [Aaosphaeria arxii CBS 175.79]|uniref:Uncharacterized protein n=1 Tax=Aaosphaeria arxii CBS 175.79 TaxID=1450172 RepID=A0A6A5XWJ4_9PLEO|nr:uncharacterized protein BU24DRAFT_420038 [Aaosphaeria arxii CBS 175.79]KAF2017010.1 hypothetical protein BU24DRAFT_420038 [Aaosphaeria arxii CBS 175.79]
MGANPENIPLDEDHLLQEFEAQHEAGTVVYDTAQRLIPYTSGPKKFPLLFYVTTAFSKKPQLGGSEETKEEPVYPIPGSDIDVTGYTIADIDDHVLAWNKFAMFKAHMILLTHDGYRRQHAPLELDNVRALWKVLRNLEGEHEWYGFYNCGRDGGCSRLHKHMQVFPLHKKDGFRMFPDTGLDEDRVPFRYLLHRFDEVPDPDEIFNVYVELLTRARLLLGLGGADETSPCPHNVVLCKRWIVVVPRRMNRYEGLGVNAVGMMGMVGLSKEEYPAWLKVGPEKILVESGVAVDESSCFD